MTSPQQKIRGVLERIVFLNEENQYCVAEVKPSDGSPLVTIAGILPHVQCGETLSLEGQWSRHPKFGDQFKISRFKAELPATVHGIRKYLGSGLVQGIGPGLAEKIVDFFGDQTLRVLSSESGRLQKIPGIGKQRAKAIKEAWDKQALEREIMIFLQTYGVTPGQCLCLTQHFGSETRKILKEEPFRMAREIHGIGFKTADKIARNLGLPNDHRERIEAGFLHVLAECEEEGHTRFPTTGLVEKTATLLELPEAPLLPILREMVKRKDLLAKVDAPGEESFIQSVPLAKAEETIAKQIQVLLDNANALPSIKVEKAIEWAQDRARFAFAAEQANALQSALENKISILTGGPGTGKTTILNALVAILKAKKVPLQLGAPTGRASRRLSASARHHSQTIHRLLKFDAQTGGFTANETQPLKADFVIIDESSMLDTRLASSLLRALSPKTHLVLVGDADQLPSVGPGQVFRDLMNHHDIPVIRLNSVFRQKSGNDIVNLAHQINQGKVQYPLKMEKASGFDRSRDAFFLPTENPETARHWIVELVSQVLPDELGVKALSDIQVLAPMHRGETGVGNLNQRLQEALNPTQSFLPFGSLNFRPGDRLIQTRNNYDKMVFNGDMGTVVSIDPSARTLVASFEGQEHQYEKDELSELSLAYAISIHKSQGSEYPIVVIPILRQHYMMLQRNLIYTALTRAKSKAIFVGDPRAYAMAIRNASSHQRHTGLPRLIAT